MGVAVALQQQKRIPDRSCLSLGHGSSREKAGAMQSGDAGARWSWGSCQGSDYIGS